MSDYSVDVSDGKRFEFGKNWARFLAVVDDDRIGEAVQSLRDLLQCDSLTGRSFLDIGSGSGLFSLAARKLGARVHSFDYDPTSVACTRELKARYFPEDGDWTVAEGSALDSDYIRSLGTFDVVYSWGVLHHTGDMWRALETATIPVQAGGQLYIALYNDQGARSKRWLRVKRFYCSGGVGRAVVLGFYFPYFTVAGFLLDAAHGKNPLTRYREYKKKRGMSIYYDWVDWLGGLPFEVAKADDVIEFFSKRGFELTRKITTTGLGCNQFVFRYTPPS